MATTEPTKRNTERDSQGRYAKGWQCHACGKHVSNNDDDYFTDVDALDHPSNENDLGWAICSKTKRCEDVADWDVEKRIIHYRAQRAENQAARDEGRRTKCLIAQSKKNH